MFWLDLAGCRFSKQTVAWMNEILKFETKQKESHFYPRKRTELSDKVLKKVNFFNAWIKKISAFGAVWSEENSSFSM